MYKFIKNYSLKTIEKQVDGVKFDHKGIRKELITVRLTVDKRGGQVLENSLSFSDDKTVMLSVPLEELSEMIKAVK